MSQCEWGSIIFIGGRFETHNQPHPKQAIYRHAWLQPAYEKNVVLALDDLVVITIPGADKVVIFYRR